jgi:hypothetical protein
VRTGRDAGRPEHRDLDAAFSVPTGDYGECVTLQWLPQLAPSVATLGAASFGLLRGQGKLRRNLRHDVDLAKDLPEDSAARRIMMEHIEQQVSTLRARELGGEQGVRRDWTSFTIGMIFALAGGYGCVWFFSNHAWWRWAGLLPGVLAAFGLVMLVEGLVVTPRGARRRAADEGA